MNLWENFSFVYYQDQSFYYFRKPAGFASSRWKSVSFLDLMCDEGLNWDIRDILNSQLAFFWKEKELWLLNRLDWPTTGLLYFAKNPRVYSEFRHLQKEEMVSHRALAPEVFETAYGDGSRTVVNYGDTALNLGGVSVPAVGYVLIGHNGDMKSFAFDSSNGLVAVGE